MKRNLAIKVLVLAGAVFSTWALTTSILAHFKQEKHAESTRVDLEEPADLTPASVISSKKVVSNGKAKTESFLQSPPKANSQRLKRFAANNRGHILNVEAEVEINDQRQDRCYVWTLYVLNTGDKSAQLVHVYDNQVFTIPESGNLSPTFHEVTELPSGNYDVILTLSRLPKDSDLNTLKDPKILSRPNSLRGFATVQID